MPKPAKTLATIEITVQQGVGVVWMNRPEVRNALNAAMVGELIAALAGFATDDDVRAIVLAGHGPVFCAGADIKEGRPAKPAKNAATLAALLLALDALPKPTVARVHGSAFGGGLALIGACDIAVAATGAEFSVSEVRLGLAPAIVGPYVMRAIGESQARRYFLTGERFSAAEAYRIGLVHELAQDEALDATVNAILGHLVQGGPNAQRATKKLIAATAGKPITTALLKAAERRAGHTSAEAIEGLRAFRGRRAPPWHPEA
jgi:methylglutaconyl-CoA hydratase